MRRMQKLSLVVVALSLCAAGLAAQKSGLSGEWVFDVQTEAGSGSPTFVLKQSGDQLTGRYKGTFGEADVKGSVSGKTFKIVFDVDAQGTALTMTYNGEIESESTVKGTVDLGGMGSGSFTGKRVK
jgi:hypothetical protein